MKNAVSSHFTFAVITFSVPRILKSFKYLARSIHIDGGGLKRNEGRKGVKSILFSVNL